MFITYYLLPNRRFTCYIKKKIKYASWEWRRETKRQSTKETRVKGRYSKRAEDRKEVDMCERIMDRKQYYRVYASSEIEDIRKMVW